MERFVAVYKVIQDIEAEDKLLGPLTLKGFIYAAIAAVCAFINFRLLISGIPLKWVIILILLGPMLLFGVLASPLGREQPTEVWLLSRIRFFLKPRLHVWTQGGSLNLVTITVPKKVDRQLTKSLTQHDVQSRLKTLALTLDTRGWAIKDVNVNMNEPSKRSSAMHRPEAESDRLVTPAEASAPQNAPVDVKAEDDILDDQNNPTAQKFANMIAQADNKRRQSVMETMKQVIDDSSDKSASKKTSKRHARHKSHKDGDSDRPATNSSLVEKKPAEEASSSATTTSTNTVTATRQADNMELAQSGSAFSVATLQQLANREPKIEQTGPNEVTISLH